jgi:phosphatidylserine/phosphatidylglycerophosphate/cardiolipin synthase-like enzyme
VQFANILGEFVVNADSDTLRTLSRLVASGQITSDTSPLELRRIEPTIDSPHVFALLKEWSRLGRDDAVSPDSVVLALDTAQGIRSRQQEMRIEFVWTGPIGMRTGLRTTYLVARELIGSARDSVLLVDYSLNFNPERAGAGSVVLDDLKAAAARGVHIKFIVHDDPANWLAIQKSWPLAAARPAVLTWTPAETAGWQKLHAKLILTDDVDLLVTSANLTYHGLERNMELGIRLRSDACRIVADHFASLARAGVLRPRHSV